jgi:hypothetical protein
MNAQHERAVTTDMLPVTSPPCVLVGTPAPDPNAIRDQGT